VVHLVLERAGQQIASFNRVLHAVAVEPLDHCALGPDDGGVETWRAEAARFLELRPVALRAKQLVLKRAMDIVGAVVILVLLAPLLAVIAALVALDSPGPVIFTQRRLGRFGRPIRCYKFRSMQVDAEERLHGDPILFRRYVEHDYKLPASMDTRITRVGHFLRRASLDELPQLYNVIKGDMNIVGPRPERPTIFAELRQTIPQYHMRQRVKPGITGWAQVNQAYDACLDDVRQKVSYDLEYIQRRSVREDLRIMTMTIPVMLFRHGGW
jgi:lipopolysaccharide/colanic/teichoic acid biosynthesis glycosyltransferase